MIRETFDTAEPVTVAEPKPAAGPIAAFFKKVMTQHRRRRQNELGTLSDRALQDIGVTRRELRWAGIRPMEFDAIRFLGSLRIPDARYETRPYK